MTVSSADRVTRSPSDAPSRTGSSDITAHSDMPTMAAANWATIPANESRQDATSGVAGCETAEQPDSEGQVEESEYHRSEPGEEGDRTLIVGEPFPELVRSVGEVRSGSRDRCAHGDEEDDVRDSGESESRTSFPNPVPWVPDIPSSLVRRHVVAQLSWLAPMRSNRSRPAYRSGT